MSSRFPRVLSIAALGLACALAVPAPAAAQQLGLLLERVARGLDTGGAEPRTDSASSVGWLLPRVPRPSLAGVVRSVSEAELMAAGPASLRVSLVPSPIETRHVARNPDDIVSLVGALDLRALLGAPMEVYLGFGMGAQYRVPAMVVNGDSGLAARMGLGVNLQLDANWSVSAGVDAIGLFRPRRDVWTSLADDRELQGATLLPVHARLRLVI